MNISESELEKLLEYTFRKGYAAGNKKPEVKVVVKEVVKHIPQPWDPYRRPKPHPDIWPYPHRPKKWYPIRITKEGSNGNLRRGVGKAAGKRMDKRL